MGRILHFWRSILLLSTILISAQWRRASLAAQDVPPLEPAQRTELAEQIHGSGDMAKAFAAPINRKQGGNSVVINGEPKPFFKIHYRDGIQKAILDETPRRVPPDFEDSNDVGGGGREFDDAYEDTRLVEPRNEAPLFIPFLYRNESEEEGEASSTQAAPARTTRPLVAPDLLGNSRQPIIVRTTTQSPFGGRPTPAIRPAQPFGRPPPIPAQRPPPQSPQSILPQQPLPAFQQGPPPPPPQQFRPQQPQIPQPQQPPPPRFPAPAFPQPLPPTRPPPPQQPQLPRPAQPGGNVRTGVCRHTIFYTPQPVTGFDIQRVYTHFAVVVSVDQCARTCHEFNCDVAILDPRTRHCQFNPSIAFRLSPNCPQWPNPLLYRNNVQLGDELVKIQCVTCQQRRRGQRPAGAQQLPASLPPSGLGQQQQSSLRRPSQPQFVLRTTTRDRIGNAELNGNSLNASPIQRVANAAKTKNFAGTNGNDEEPQGQTERNLSEEFHKLERLLKSAEDYLDENGNRGKTPGGGGGRQKGKGREVPSWREGHPQGDGFSPLKINPLRSRPPPPPSAELRPSPIFYSTDTLKNRNEEELRQKRAQRESPANADPPEDAFAGNPLPAGGKPKLNSAGSVKLQAQEPAGLRELPLEGDTN